MLKLYFQSPLQHLWWGLRFTLLLGALLTVGGCMVANSVVTPSTTLDFRSSTALNPDITGRPSPLVVRVLELSEVRRFESADFFRLYEHADQELGSDLLKTHELEIQPGQIRVQDLQLHPATRHLGIIAAYRDIESARWRVVLTAKPKHYKTLQILLQPLALDISQP